MDSETISSDCKTATLWPWRKEDFLLIQDSGPKLTTHCHQTSMGRKAMSLLPALWAAAWPLGLWASACCSQNAWGGNSCPELWMWLIAFSWLAHQRPAPSPALISAGSWESGCWLPAGEAGRLSCSQQFMEVTRLASSSVFSCPLKQYFE